MSQHVLNIEVNKERVQIEVRAHRLLSELLRDDLHLTGTKRGCETGTCGACSVMINGKLVKACLLLAVQVDAASITTIEGLGSGDTLHPLQRSFAECGGLQCGYCTPGMIMTAKSLLEENPSPTEEEVREGLGANLCRCTGYNGIVDAVLHASEVMRGS
ncbi:(2Fe-2S)-binding protein [Pusillimonas noertemannii]|uniref:Carbon-monoxide dehydrogenase small subunit n=1 Tax=Pusillimonas noertemannii TaxID=305977 RepID=A0A2U1CPK7_9BURK|nr:(2Fe-2S)-binding protein [Pusillimonas noertemannii]NYT67152.1 (2Fe-2S)-binding protein [Pusillimonas noertemannii]PVY67827.1 carbon-monoxide dehydrogenase small subunit [Pusillimonas noertemannii]TFL12647.1 (2Fe-2S)-binding protein [Pusillimonas noertemannii]